jgi:hypothetical protein
MTKKERRLPPGAETLVLTYLNRHRSWDYSPLFEIEPQGQKKPPRVYWNSIMSDCEDFITNKRKVKEAK